MDVRCVMTGQNESGKSVIVRNTAVKPVSLALLPGYEFHRIWGSDSVPELPSDGTPPAQPNYFPPKSGFPSITWERIASRRRPAFPGRIGVNYARCERWFCFPFFQRISQSG